MRTHGPRAEPLISGPHVWTQAEIDATYQAGRENWVQGLAHFDDNIRATARPESIDGCSGDDVIRAGGGNDYIIGGDGTDMMFGGAGRDVFQIGDECPGPAPADQIRDFTRGEDVLYLGMIEGVQEPLAWDRVHLHDLGGGREFLTVDGTNVSVLVTVLGQGGMLDQSDFFLG